MKDDQQRIRAVRQILVDPFAGHNLTERQKEVATLVATSNLTQKEIAEKLDISRSAIAQILDRVCKVIGVSSSKRLSGYIFNLLRNAAGL